MNYWLISLLALHLLGLGYAMAKHGEPRDTTTHNFWVSLFAMIILWSILYMAGALENMIQ